jgi:hypothetical protein
MTITFFRALLKTRFWYLGVLLSVIMPAPSASGQSDEKVQDVSFCMLSNRPTDFARQRIRIRGVFRFALEEEVLEQPECCLGGKVKKIRVSIDGNPVYPNAHSQQLTRELFKRASGVSLVVFVGTFQGGVLKVDKVEKIERLARPRDIDHDPVWVPRDCPQNGQSTEQIITPALNHESGHVDPSKRHRPTTGGNSSIIRSAVCATPVNVSAVP